MSTNPFAQPFPSHGIVFKARFYRAKESGKNLSSTGFKVVATSDYLWLGRELSVPLVWISSIVPVGPGFRLEWDNRITSVREVEFYCVRSMLGYNRTRRDRIVAELQNLVSHAAKVPPVAPVWQSEKEARCQICNSANAHQYDFILFFNLLLYSVSQSERRIFCAEHARKRLLQVLLSNTLLGTLGLPGALVTPLLVFRQGQCGRAAGLISTTAVLLFTGISAVPLIYLLVVVICVIHSMA